MFCIKCGVQNPDGSDFCYQCGKPLFKPEQQSEVRPTLSEDAAAHITGQLSREVAAAGVALHSGGQAPADTTDHPIGSIPPYVHASANRWATAYGWLWILSAVFLLVSGLATLLTGQNLAPPASPFGNAKPMGAVVALTQALLFGATGLAIIQKRKIAVALIWITVALSGLGVLFRGLVPLDFSLWLVGLGLAIWYSLEKFDRSIPSTRGGTTGFAASS